MKLVSNLLGILKGEVIKVEHICCENLGEYMSKLKTLYQNEGIELEYIARGSPK